MNDYKAQVKHMKRVRLFLKQGGKDYPRREAEAVARVQEKYPGHHIRIMNPALYAGEVESADAIVHDGSQLPKGVTYRCTGGSVVALEEPKKKPMRKKASTKAVD
jgi:hypothetical protein